VRIRLAKPPGEVWPVIRNFASWPDWNPGVKEMTRLPDSEGRERWKLSDASGGFPSLVEVSEAPAGGKPGRLRTRIDDPSLPFGGTWTWEVQPAGGGTDVTITEDGEIHNPIFRLLAKTVFGHHGTAEGYLKALGRNLGQAATTERIR